MGAGAAALRPAACPRPGRGGRQASEAAKILKIIKKLSMGWKWGHGRERKRATKQVGNRFGTRFEMEGGQKLTGGSDHDGRKIDSAPGGSPAFSGIPLHHLSLVLGREIAGGTAEDRQLTDFGEFSGRDGGRGVVGSDGWKPCGRASSYPHCEEIGWSLASLVEQQSGARR